MPAAATQNTEEGFKAFTQYWFDTVSYALESGDAEALEVASDPACKVCGGYVTRAAQVKTGEFWYLGPKWTVTSFSSDMTPNPNGQVLGYFLLAETPSTKFEQSGKILATSEPTPDSRPKAVYANYKDGRWIAHQVGQA
jgi:hypothetical protein